MALKNQHKRDAKLAWVPLGKMKVLPIGQRKLRQAWVEEIAAHFAPEEIGNPTVHNNRNDSYNIIDGQHRIEAMKSWLGDGWEDQCIQCWVYEGLTESEQSEKFLKLNNVKVVSSFDKFKVAVTAGRKVEVHVEKIVQSNGLAVCRVKGSGNISAVGALVRVYDRGGAETLDRTLRIIRDALGDVGFQTAVIDGIGHLCQRYNGQLNDEVAIERLGGIHAGVSGLMAKAEVLHKQTGNGKALCVAAAAVDIINSKRGGKKLPSWWSES